MSKRSFPNRGRKSGRSSQDSRDNNTGKPANNRKSSRNTPPGERKSTPFSSRRESGDSDKRGGRGSEKRSNFTKVNKKQDGDRPFSKPKRSTGRDDERESRPRKFGKPSSFGENKEGRTFRAGKKDGPPRRDDRAFDRPKRSSGREDDREKRPRKYGKPGSSSFGENKEGRTYRAGKKDGPPRREDRPFDRPKRSSGNDGDRESRPRKFGKSSGSSFGNRPERKGGEPRQERSGFSKRRTSFESDKPESSSAGKTSRGRVDKKSSEPYQAETPVQTDKIRLNRYIANSGVCSRREADELITMGLISVNGKTITELGYKVNPGDEVRYESKVLRAEKPVYILLNKPKGFLTTTSDPQERNTVMHLIGDKIRERIYPVGRLDRNTTGLLLLTNDGDLADKLMHPSYNVKKIYKVELDRPLSKPDFEKIMEGVQLEEGRAMVDDLAIVSDDGKIVGIELHIGWNRVVRRIFEALEYDVVKLDRSVYAGLDKKDLPRGHWRFLRKEEVVRLKHFK